MESSLFITACSNLNMVLLKSELLMPKDHMNLGSNLNMVFLKFEILKNKINVFYHFKFIIITCP